MTLKFNTIALMGNCSAAGVLESIQILADYLPGLGAQVIVSALEDIPNLPESATKLDPEGMMKAVDLVIAVGGDGSMLTAARAAASANIPLVGVNRGRLGFLADVSPGDKLESLEHILTGNYDSEKRMLLRADIISKDGTTDCGSALNDIVIKRHQIGRMLDFQTSVDGHYVNTHGGDGFIVATPTGSTAYALSCGGPIVAPNLDAVVLTPICPHTLSDRPLVIPATSITEVAIAEGHADNAEVSCDGEVTGYLGTGQTLRVEAAAHRVELIHPSGYDYYEILRNKLYWGRGNRKSLANM
jgi:NAD+ kinase